MSYRIQFPVTSVVPRTSSLADPVTNCDDIRIPLAKKIISVCAFTIIMDRYNHDIIHRYSYKKQKKLPIGLRFRFLKLHSTGRRLKCEKNVQYLPKKC